MGDLSAHFSRSEFSVDGRRGSETPPSELVWCLEDLRRRIGRPLPLVSWKRSPAYSRSVVGHRSVWHERGLAVDIPKGLVTVDQARLSGFRGIGTNGRWVVHLDLRPGPVTVFVDKGPGPKP